MDPSGKDTMCDSMSTPSPLERLPLDLLLVICKLLVRFEPKRKRSLYAFSLASKTCCNATNIERFRIIYIDVATPRKAQDDTERWRQVLETNNRQLWVRAIKFNHVINPSTSEKQYQAIQIFDKRVPPREPGSLAYAWDDEDGTELDCFRGMDEKSTLSGFYRQTWSDGAWLPVASLMKDLPGLQDIFWASWNQFPPPLLSELHLHHPNSRLHMERFHLSSLMHSVLSPQRISHQDLALATSPCLRSIRLCTQLGGSPERVDYNMEAVLQMADGVAPRLETVEVFTSLGQATPASAMMRSWNIPRPEWQGFPSSAMERDTACHSVEQQRIQGGIKNLVLGSVGTDSLREWIRAFDFRVLRSLHISSLCDLDAVRQLTRRSQHAPLKALNSLSLTFSAMDVSPSETDTALADFLVTFTSLEDVVLLGPMGEETLDALMERHCSRLRKLYFDTSSHRGTKFSIGAMQAKKLAQTCRQLEEVHVPVTRSEGNGEEVKVYRWLGQLPMLRVLTLRLFCPIRTIPLPPDSDPDDDEESDYDPYGGVYWNGGGQYNGGVTIPIFQDVFKNVAMDADLSMQIFRQVDQKKRLRTVMLEPEGSSGTGVFGPFSRWVGWLGRRWKIRQNAEGDVKIEEVDKERREEHGTELDADRAWEDQRMLKAAWDSLWPPKTELWYHEWSSFPLSQDPK